jgi:Zn-dependent peptidase ImmA (M78 family)/transcriptional regulator with XRE-family HTH domain
MVTYRPTINPALLVWARQSINLPQERAAAVLDVSLTTLQSWESGDQFPTIVQLRKVSEKYRRPLGVFFLPVPPVDPAPPHDFRTVTPGHIEALSPELLIELRRARARRAIALELLSDLERTPTTLQLRVRVEDDAEQVGTRVRNYLRVRLTDQAGWTIEGEAFRGWKAAMERRGVLVFQMRRVSYREVRGFSIAEYPLPVIVVNGSDFANAKTFTLLHEFVHLLLHLSGICDPLALVRPRRSFNSRIESFCNHVAAAALVPASSLLNQPLVATQEDREDWSDDVLRQIARTYAVSTLVIVRRLLTLGWTTAQFYDSYHERIVALAERHRSERTQEGGAPRPVMVLADMGRAFTSTVLEAYENQVIGASDVSEYLRVKVPQIPEVKARLHASTPE